MTTAGSWASSVWTQLEKILGSRLFVGSQHIGRLLRFAVEEALRDGGSELNGGPQGFGRNRDSRTGIRAYFSEPRCHRKRLEGAPN
jgi:hypothetical protein